MAARQRSSMGRMVCIISAGLLLALVSCASCLASTDTLCDDTMGQEFYIGVLDSLYHQGSIQISLVFSGSTVCDVTVIAPSIGLNNTFTMTNHTHTVKISALVVQVSNNSVEDKSIKVYSTGDVAVELITYAEDGNEQVLILPVECLSTKYIVSTYYPNRQYPQYKSNFLVVAAQDNTSVNIGVRIGGSVSGNFTIHMDNMQSYLYNNVEDVTGTIIMSDKPVAVFSGHEAIVFRYGAYVVEQLLPSVHYGSSYIVPSLYPKAQYFIRVISSESDTVVLYRNISNAIDRSVLFHTSGEFVEIISSEPLYVKANKPVSVMLYSFGYYNQGDNLGNPFLSIVPATKQYLSEYIFTVPDAFDTFENYLSIIAPYDVVNGIQLDGKSLPAVSKAFNISINGSIYTVKTYTVGTGFHRLNQLKQATFGAMIYGYSNTSYDGSGYGAPLGLGFDSLSSPVPPDMVPTNRCYTCKDMSHLYLCDTVSTCSQSQTCFVEQYRTVGGDVRYNSGCIDVRKCTNTTTSECLECCSGDYCNGKGCNGQELPPRNDRGPLCFDCQHVGNMTECHTLRLCAPDQVCGIEKYTWGGLYDHYTAKCQSRQCVSRRSIPDCLHCCTDDFCNTDCKQTDTDPAIVG